jgi:small subunit ribosomal protein S6e
VFNSFSLLNNKQLLIFTFIIGGTCYWQGRTGERKRKSVRGAIYGPDLAVISLRIVKKGDADVAGLTDNEKPNKLGPKRANNIRKMFGLRKVDDVRKYVIHRQISRNDKTYYKAPKIQRIVTEKRIRRKQLDKKAKLDKWKANKTALENYEKLLSQYAKEKKAAKAAARKEEAEKK